MPRTARLLAAAAVAAALASEPAAAQYGPDPTATSTSTTERSTEERVGNVTPEQATQGSSVTFTTDAGLPPGETGTVAIVRARQGASGTALGTATVGSDGRVSFTFTVPDVEPGIYFVVVEIAGERLVAVVVVVEVTTQASAAAARSEAPTLQGPPGGEAVAVPVAAEVRALQLPADAEADLLAAAKDGASVELQAGQLVATRPDTGAVDGASSAAPIAVATAAGVLAAAGLATRRLRHRPTAR
jgi:hypothetical protein